jgi:aspartyl-tRNA synthetase
MQLPSAYRSHYTADLTEKNVGEQVKVAGFVENIRDHGGVTFIDLRDHYGIIQLKTNSGDSLNLQRESAVSVSGAVEMRDADTVNDKIATGTIEIAIEAFSVEGAVNAALPFEVTTSKESGEEARLKYRYLDLRNKKVHETMILRSRLISAMRKYAEQLDFLELQTPIITASSPEGARDFLIPSRRHHGRFYALPQAPQIFKQLYMAGGFDRYYQIAPCFRDEDARADRTAGEFYQLDLEMSFAGQDEVLSAGEKIICGIMAEFSDKPFNAAPFVRIPYREALKKYGTDKPDLRNPLFIVDVSDQFVNSKFKPFCNKTVRAIRVPGMSAKSRTFFENMERFAFSIGMKGLGYVEAAEGGKLLGPIDKFLTEHSRTEIKNRCELEIGDVLYFIADEEMAANKFAGQIRREVAQRMDIIDTNRHEFLWITDFPMYEQDEVSGKPMFSHNPFSMPQGGFAGLESAQSADNNEIFDLLAYQYDLVMDGVELASGAVRNHEPQTMVKAFEIAGYTEEDVVERFGALYTAFKYGAPPHAGMAFGVDRLLMILRGEDNIREVIAFPLNSAGQDVMLGAPSAVSEQQLREAHINVRKKF